MKQWAHYPLLREATVLRDVGGNLSVLLQGASELPAESIETLRTSSEEALRSFRLIRLICDSGTGSMTIDSGGERHNGSNDNRRPEKDP